MTRKGSKKKGICALSTYFFAFCCAESVFFTSTFCGPEGCSLPRGCAFSRSGGRVSVGVASEAVPAGAAGAARGSFYSSMGAKPRLRFT